MNEQNRIEYDRLRKALPVDIESLHKNAEVQPDLAADIGELAASLKSEAKQAKTVLDETKAEAEREIRANPEQLPKATESAIASAVVLHQSVKDATREYLEADEDADLASSLANAYEHRRSMLKIEVQLYLGNYWGEVEVREMDKTDRNLSDKKLDRARERVQEGRKRRKENVQ